MHWMYQNGGFGGMGLFGMGTFPFWGIFPVLLWSLAWKAWALWLAARRGETVWFIALLFINTLGLLEIFYIFVIAKQNDKKDISKPKSNNVE
jgi:methionyl-tRNA synthetase